MKAQGAEPSVDAITAAREAVWEALCEYMPECKDAAAHKMWLAWLALSQDDGGEAEAPPPDAAETEVAVEGQEGLLEPSLVLNPR